MALRHARRAAVLFAVLLLAAGLVAGVAGAGDGHPLVRGDDDQLREWIAKYDAAPVVPASAARTRAATGSAGTGSVLDRVPYVAAERYQGPVANCWAWAGTGVLEVAHATGNSVRDRLSIQFLDSSFNGGSGSGWAGTGGCLADFVDFYSAEGIAVPWSNPNASYQDARAWCVEHRGAWVPASSIATTPHYDLLSIDDERVATRGVGSAEARANIRAVIDDGRALYLAMRLPEQAAWDAFEQFWRTQPESAVFSMAPYDGMAWSSTAGGHAVLVVGYDETDPADPYWIALNSWGTADGQRPHGTFRLSMNMNYDGAYAYSFTIPSTEWQTLAVRFGDAPTPAPTPAPGPVPPATALPRDLDGDGTYEDVNGNGRVDFADVTLLYNALGVCTANAPVAAFDFNGNGRVDFADVVALYGRC